MRKVLSLTLLLILFFQFLGFAFAQETVFAVPQQTIPTPQDAEEYSVNDRNPVEINPWVNLSILIIIPIIVSLLLKKYSKQFKVAGWGFMGLGILSIIYPFLMLFAFESGLRRFFWEGVVPVIFVFALTFFPGKIYYNLSKKSNVNKLQIWSACFSLISFFMLIVFIVLGLLSADAEGFVWGLFILGSFLLIPYGIGLILLIIDWIKSRSTT